jgi:hypothetical protein
MSMQKGSLNKRGNVHVTQHWDAFMQPLLLLRRSNKYYILWECDCSLRCPACNAHALYCRLWPAQLHKIFPHDLMNGTVFANVTEYEMCVFISSTTFSEKNSHSRKNSTRYDQKYILVFALSTYYSCQISLKLKFSKDFRKMLKSQISLKSVHWISTCSMWTDGRTDGHTDMTKLIVAFRSFATAHKNIQILQSLWRRSKQS